MFRRAPRPIDALRSAAGWWRTRPVLVRDGALATVFLGLSFMPGIDHNGIDLAELPKGPLDTLGTALLLGQCLPLAMRRWSPALCLAITAGAFSAHQLLAYPMTFASESLIVALYSIGAHQNRFRPACAATATVAYVALALTLHAEGSPEQPVQYVTFYGVLTTFWMAGTWMRARTAQEAERRLRAARSAIAEERARIARELHDVVTHHVTAMVVQADAGRFLIDGSPERVAEGLTAISGTGRRALEDLRHLLGVLDGRGDTAAEVEAPAPERLRDLVERTRSAGQPVELTEEGERRPMSSGAELAAYRVVQEALTNALKHAPGAATLVHVRHGPGEVDVEVTTDGPATATAGSGDGRGLAGMRERVSVFGGELLAGDRPGGGFVVRARIPSGNSL